MRVTMSRMDVLTKTEIHEINNKSKLVKKYGELIDRKSAYEILNKKIAFDEEQLYQKENDENSQKQQRSSSGTVVSVRKSVLKVLASATFIRGAFGILTKMFKK